jgi:hypothetical protein
MLTDWVEQDQVFVAQRRDAQMTDELVRIVSEGAPVVWCAQNLRMKKRTKFGNETMPLYEWRAMPSSVREDAHCVF